MISKSLSFKSSQLRSASAASISAVCILLMSGAAGADPLRIGNDKTYIKVGGLLQGWANVQEDASPDDTVETELYLRRMRLMVYGQLNDMVNFFASK